MKHSSVIAGLALGSVMTLGGCASNPFAAEPMSQGHHHTDKHRQGSCSDSSMHKDAQGSCGASKKTSEGKCGEGKCGG